MRRALYSIIGLVLVGLFGYTLWFLYQKSQETPMVPTSEKPFYTDIIRKTVATGSVVPRREILIKPNISGVIKKVFVEAGEQVKKGDVLAEVRVIPDMVQLNNAENRLSRAEIDFENAERNFNRQKELNAEGVISDAEFETTSANFESAKQELEAAKDNLDIIKEGASKKTAASANTKIRSTVNGMILDVPVEVGNSVIEANNFNEGTTIAAVADMQDMVFEGKVDESEVGKIKEGMPLILTVGAIEDETFDATLEYISPKGIDENGAIQFEIKAKVNLQDSSFIRAGYSANAAIVLDQRKDVLAVNEALLHFEDDKTYVEILKSDQSTEKVFIKTGLSDGINIEVISGIDSSAVIKSGMVPVGEANQEKRGKGRRGKR